MNENRAMSNTESSDASAGQDLKVEQNSGFVMEKHPNLTLLESGQNPGDILRIAREKAGCSLSDISAQTKINEKQLEAIESGDVARLPPETFAKAFIKSYCKALKLDPGPIILSYGFSEKADAAGGSRGATSRAGSADASRTEPLEPKMPSSSKRLSTLNFDQKTGKKSLSYGIVLAAIAVMAVFYIPVFLSNQAEEPAAEPELQPEIAVNEAPASDVTAGDSLALQPDNLGGVTGDGLPSSVFPALQQQADPATGAAPVATPDALGLKVTPAPSALPSQPSQPAVPPVAVAPPAVLVPPAAAVPPAVAAVPPAVVTPPAATAPGKPLSSLNFRFQEQSWVTVRDANDKVLISQLNDAGSNLEVRGQPPFKLIVGNAKSVNILSNGKPVDLSSTIRGEVARITIE